MPSAADTQTITPDTLEDFLEVRLIANAESRFLERIEVTYGIETQSWARSVYPIRQEDPKVPLSDAQIEQNEQSRRVFKSLNDFVINIVGSGSSDPGSGVEIEAEIDADTALRYEDTILAVEAISGYRDDNRQIIKLIEKIKFRDRSAG